MARGAKMYEFDCKTVTIDDLREKTSEFSFKSDLNVDLHGFATWFDVIFAGSDTSLTLSTSPKQDTHWAQTLFYFNAGEPVGQDDVIKGSIAFRRNAENHRAVNLDISFTINDARSHSKSFIIK